MRELLNNTKVKKSEEKITEEMFNKILFNEDISHVIHMSNSNDDMVYPIHYDTLKDREIYKRVIIKSTNEE